MPRKHKKAVGSPRFRLRRRLAQSERAQRVAELAGTHTQAAIAKLLGISQPTVSKVTSAIIDDRWERAGELGYKVRSEKAALVHAEYERLSDQEGRLSDVEERARAAWERSLLDSQKTRTEGAPAAGAATATRVVVEREGQHGDPRFLEILRQCAETRQRLAVRRAELVVKWCEIMGLHRQRPWEDEGQPPPPGLEVQPGDAITIVVRGDGRLARPPALPAGSNGRTGQVRASDHE